MPRPLPAGSNGLLFIGIADPLNLSCPGDPVASLVGASIRVHFATLPARLVGAIHPYAGLCRRDRMPLAQFFVRFATATCHVTPLPQVSGGTFNNTCISVAHFQDGMLIWCFAHY